MLAQIEATLERFRVHFDTWALQSELEQRLPELLPRLDTYEKDGAVWAPVVGVRRRGRPGDHPLAGAGGTPTYRAADIVYLVDKLERGFDRAIYVLGADHHGTRKWYAAIARMLGYDPERVEVLLYQFVHLSRGGEQTKISKRRGDVVFLDELMDEIGVDAARWYLVSRGPDQTIEIDVDLAKEKTSEEPRLLRPVRPRPDRRDLQEGGRRAGRRLRRRPSSPTRRTSLVRRLLELPGIAAEATERRGPHAIPTYAIRVADDFHRFYTEHRVLGERRAGVPARPLPRDADGGRALPRPDRGRSSRAHVTAIRP